MNNNKSITVHLSKQKYNVFNIEKNEKLELKNKNFIFGKNGSGKSTLTSLIKEEFASEYDVRIFTGFESVVEDNRLNAIILGDENIAANEELKDNKTKINEAQKKLDALNFKYNSLNWNSDYLEDIGESQEPLYIKKEETKKKRIKQQKKIDRFLTIEASSLKKESQPQITSVTYNKEHLKKDLIFAKELQNSEYEYHLKILRENEKEKIENFEEINTSLKLSSLLEEANELITYEMEEAFSIKEFSNDVYKKRFADEGRSLHKPGETCAFCGNEYTLERSLILQRYFTLAKMEEYTEKLDQCIKKIKNEISIYEEIKLFDEDKFYTIYQLEVININEKIKIKLAKIVKYLKELLEVLIEKQRNNFVVLEEIKLEIPLNIDYEIERINDIIDRNNTYTENIMKNKEKSKEKIKLHRVNEIKIKTYAGWNSYDEESNILEALERKIIDITDNIKSESDKILGDKKNPEPNTINFLEKEIEKLNLKQEEILSKVKNTSVLAKRINEKLEKIGKTNLKLKLTKEHNEIEHYVIENSENETRSIDKVSTGEKNIIAFLYFVENLSNSTKEKNKIIIFDDPMNSNDDTMQYLIIIEILSLYRSRDKKKYDNTRDYFICLTHNAYFYVNIQPSAFKDENDKSRYDKNNFYKLQGGEFNLIKSSKDDITTQYSSLWMELEFLYNHNIVHAMINVMRRILETYCKFNKINTNDFYKDSMETQKLFNVNSHSIDDLSIESLGYTKDSILNIFKQVFVDNNAEVHYTNNCRIIDI